MKGSNAHSDVDNYDFLHDLAEGMGFGQFGGNLSVRKPMNVKPHDFWARRECVHSIFVW